MNKKDTSNVFEWFILALLMFAVVVIVAFGTFSQVEAAGNPITVCRRPGYFNPSQFEFRNIPLNWFVWGDEAAPSWGYWAQGVAMDTENGILFADALAVDTDGYKAKTVALVDYTDKWTLVANDNTPFCDVPPTPTPAPAPIAPKAVDSCPAWAVDGTQGGKVCLFDLPRATS